MNTFDYQHLTTLQAIPWLKHENFMWLAAPILNDICRTHNVRITRFAYIDSMVFGRFIGDKFTIKRAIKSFSKRFQELLRSRYGVPAPCSDFGPNRLMQVNETSKPSEKDRDEVPVNYPSLGALSISDIQQNPSIYGEPSTSPS